MEHATSATHTHTKRGFSTIEILIAFSVGMLFLSAALMIAMSDPSLTRRVSLESGQGATLDAILDSGALYRAQNTLGDTLHALASEWQATVDTEHDDTYVSSATITDISPCMKVVENATTWASLHDRVHTVSFGTAIGNIGVARALGPGGCDPAPSSTTWDSPAEYQNGITIPSGNATDIVVAPHAGRRIAVLATVASTAETDDLYLYDVTDPAHPSAVLGSINTGTGINAIARHGAYIYALQDDSTNQLQVIRVFDTTKAPSDPAYYTPVLITQVSLKNVGGAYPEGRSIAYYDNRLYIGTWNNNIPATSPEFLIYDVASPTEPRFVGAYNVKHSVNSIALSGTYAYLATTDNAGELTIMDVADPSAPTIAGRFDLPGSSADGEAVVVLGNRAYLGLSRNTGGGSEFLMLNVSDPAHPSLTGGMSLGLKSNTQVTSIDVHGRYAFIGTTVSSAEFHVVDITSPASPSLCPCTPYDSIAKVYALQYLDGYIFLAHQAPTVITIVYDTSG